MKTSEDIKKLRAMSDSDLKKEISAKKRDHALISLRVKAGKESNFSEIKKLKRTIARIETLIMEKRYGVTNGK